MDKVIRILILEDRASDADLMEYALMDAGLAFTSRRATNEESFLWGLEEFSPDVILCDYDLPKYTGLLALAAAKARFPKVPCILVTGASEKVEERVGEILARGANDCVLKDHLDRLAPAVYRVLGFVRGKQ